MAGLTLSAMDVRRAIFGVDWQARDGHAFTVQRIHDRVIEWAVNNRLIDDAKTLSHEQRTQIAILVADAVWELVLADVFAPGIAGNLGTAYPYLRITQYGKECLKAGELTPYDPDGYLQRIRAASSAIDPITLLYLGEGLQTFRFGNYLATAVMVGVASEKILLKVVQAVHANLDPTRQQKFDQATKGKGAKEQHDQVLARLKTSATPLPDDFNEVMPQHLDGIFNIIRRTRNDTGHPTGRQVDRQETHALLLLFPAYCKTAHELIDWLGANRL